MLLTSALCVQKEKRKKTPKDFIFFITPTVLTLRRARQYYCSIGYQIIVQLIQCGLSSLRNMFVCVHISTLICHVYLCVFRWQEVLVGAAQRTTVTPMPGRQANPAACPVFTTTFGKNQFVDSLLLLRFMIMCWLPLGSFTE